MTGSLFDVGVATGVADPPVDVAGDSVVGAGLEDGVGALLGADSLVDVGLDEVEGVGDDEDRRPGGTPCRSTADVRRGAWSEGCAAGDTATSSLVDGPPS